MIQNHIESDYIWERNNLIQRICNKSQRMASLNKFVFSVKYSLQTMLKEAHFIKIYKIISLFLILLIGMITLWYAWRTYWIFKAIYVALNEDVTYYDANNWFPIKAPIGTKIALKNTKFWLWIEDPCRTSGGIIIERYFTVDDFSTNKKHESCLCPKWKSYYENSCQ